MTSCRVYLERRKAENTLPYEHKMEEKEEISEYHSLYMLRPDGPLGTECRLYASLSRSLIYHEIMKVYSQHSVSLAF